VVNCHCSMCRKATGAAFRTSGRHRDRRISLVGRRGSGFEVPVVPGGNTDILPSLRATLPTFLAGELAEVGLPLGTLDGDPGVRPSAHIFVGSKAPWFEITDALPQFLEADDGELGNTIAGDAGSDDDKFSWVTSAQSKYGGAKVRAPPPLVFLGLIGLGAALQRWCCRSPCRSRSGRDDRRRAGDARGGGDDPRGSRVVHAHGAGIRHPGDRRPSCSCGGSTGTRATRCTSA